jgi:adenine/guanine/hypoxanthine permease
MQSGFVERWFGVARQGSSIRTELVAGVTTFLTMAYIMFVNPSILAAAGMDPGAVFVATCVAAMFGSLVMGVFANYPVALAPGMGLNAYFAYTVVGAMGYTWQVALGAVFISGVLFVVLSVLPVRSYIINNIPAALKYATAAGIGLFLALIGLKNAGLVIAHPATLVALGEVKSGPVLLFGGGFVLMTALYARRIPGAILIGILGVAVLGFALGISDLDLAVSLPPDPSPTFLQMDLENALSIGILSVIFVFLFVDLFDTTGTLVGLAERSGMLDEKGRLPRANRALLADSSATVVGAVMGTSTTTSYIESAAGINAGGRTGLVAVTVAALFGLSLFLAPLAVSIPPYATAPALLLVACLMIGGVTKIDWDDVTEYVPAVITVLFMPLTFSIANGIGAGFIAYAAIKILSGRVRQVHISVAVVAILAAIKFAYFR